MAEDFDVEAMLEAPFNSQQQQSTNGILDHNNKIRLEDDDRKRKRSRSKERKRSSHSRSPRERKHKKSSKRSRSRERKRDRKSKSKERRSRSRERQRRKQDDDRNSKRYRNNSHSPRRRSSSYHREDRILEEADRRTVFCMQLAARVRPRDLEDFFTKVGRVREVRLIMDNKTRKHKGIAYIEFVHSQSVSLALQLNGQKLCGYPITIQPTQAEKNKSTSVVNNSTPANHPLTTVQAIKKQTIEPLRLYVGSLHFNVTEDMLKSIFEPFGEVTKIELMRDTETLRSKGYGFITFAESDQAKKALEQLNGYELAGRPMKVNTTTERGLDGVATSSSSSTGQLPTLDNDELDRTGIPVSTTTRLQLMKKLAEGTGIELPNAIKNSLAGIASLTQQSSNGISNNSNESPELITTPCFMLSNMFDPLTENQEVNWPETIKEEVLEECNLHGGANHIHVDSNSKGNVYVKATSISSAIKCVSSLHGRWFDGKLVTAAYIPLSNYYQLFPAAITSNAL